jgi:mRNA interferase ChpB
MGFGLKTDGAIHLHQLKSLDWAVRKAQFVEKVPDVLLQEVLERLLTVLE